MPLAAQAQKPVMPVVGYLSANSSSGDARPAAAFVQGLGQTGYEDGKTVKIEYRWADGQYDRLPSMAADLVRNQVAVIAALGTPAVRVAKAATATIPIAFATIADPVQIGFVNKSEPSRWQFDRCDLVGSGGRTEAPGNTARGGAVGHSVIALLVNPTNPNSEMQSRNTQLGGPQARVRTPRSECQRAKRFRDGLYKAARTQGERVDYRPRRIFQCRKRTACGTNGTLMRSPRSTRCRSSRRLVACSATVPAGAMRGAMQVSMSDES